MRRGGPNVRWAWFFAIAAAVCLPRIARADLRAEALDVKRGLEADGALVVHLDPVFLEAGGTVLVEPRKLATSSDACLTLIVLGARTTELSVVRADESEPIDAVVGHLSVVRDANREEATEGLYVHTACNGDSGTFDRAAVRMRSRRGAVEMLIARSMTPPPSLATLQAARAEGASAPASDAGNPLAPLPIALRKARVVAHERELGAIDIVPVTTVSAADGTGEVALHVRTGCHSFDVLSSSRTAFDLDAELHGREAGTVPELVVADRAEVPDAHLETCSPSLADFSLRFTGAGPSTEVTVFDAVFAWPAWVSDRWGPRVASTWASLARRRSTPAPSLPPIAEVLGADGHATSFVGVEPGRCYVAMVATSHGPQRGLRLTAAASARPSIEDSGAGADGASVVFCSEDQDTARIEIDAAPAARWWVLSVWPLGRGAP